MTVGSYRITIQIQNASASALTLQFGLLSDGVWIASDDGKTQDGAAPQPGTILDPTGTLTYVNAATSNLGRIGGTIQFSTASGGGVSFSWISQPGSSPSIAAQSNSPDVTVQYSVYGASTVNPTAQYLVLPLGTQVQA